MITLAIRDHYTGDIWVDADFGDGHGASVCFDALGGTQELLVYPAAGLHTLSLLDIHPDRVSLISPIC